MADYLDIKITDETVEKKVKQRLKFRTGHFVWRVKFNIPLDPRSINNNNIYVTDENNNILDTLIRYNETENLIEIEPRKAYSQEKNYFLNVSTRVKSAGGRKLKESVQLQFKID